MVKSMQVQQFLQTLSTRKQVAVKASRIVRAILEAQSARLTDTARVMPGSLAARYKEIQRFVAQNDVKAGLLRLLQPDATFVIGDVTEVPLLCGESSRCRAPLSQTRNRVRTFQGD